ncbi:MAG: ORF6N domain-containing protein [Oscillospiraceae bacterium]|nr:ORF6N domain-containing protein [Oscillospiraceae bacterium]
MNEITIGKANVSIKEYKGQRVVTLSDIDTVHGRADGTARRNFNHNRQHFIEGEDYFKIQPNEIRTVGIKSNNGGIILTESGYLMLAKSFTDSIAWEVQRALVKSYFRAKEQTYEQTKLEEKPYEYVDKFYKGKPVLTAADIEHFSGVSHTTIDHALRRICKEHTDFDLLKGADLTAFKKGNPNYTRSVSSVFVIYKSGFDKLTEYCKIRAEIPEIMTENKVEKKETLVSYRPDSNDCICTLTVLNWIRKALSYNEEAVNAIDDVIKSCSMTLSAICSIK